MENISNQNQEYEEADSDEDHFFIIFKTTTGNTKSIHVNPDCPIDTSIIKYLIKCGIPEMISKPNDIYFLFNGKSIKFENKIKSKYFFKGNEKGMSLWLKEVE